MSSLGGLGGILKKPGRKCAFPKAVDRIRRREPKLCMASVPPSHNRFSYGREYPVAFCGANRRSTKVQRLGAMLHRMPVAKPIRQPVRASGNDVSKTRCTHPSAGRATSTRMVNTTHVSSQVVLAWRSRYQGMRKRDMALSETRGVPDARRDAPIFVRVSVMSVAACTRRPTK